MSKKKIIEYVFNEKNEDEKKELPQFLSVERVIYTVCSYKVGKGSYQLSS